MCEQTFIVLFKKISLGPGDQALLGNSIVNANYLFY